MSLSRRSSSAHSGFTLTELLVVVAVIAALLAVLLLGAGAIREMPRKATCLSNLRQLGATYATYAQDHQARLPLYMPAASLQGNYFINETPSILPAGNLRLMGLGIVATEFALPPKVLFCPSNTFNNYLLNSPTNLAATPFYPISTRLRSGYATCWTVQWGVTPAPAAITAMRADRALLTDVCDIRAITLFQHKTGVNVVYGDGAARWVSWSAINNAYMGLPWSGTAPSNNTAMQVYYTALGNP